MALPATGGTTTQIIEPGFDPLKIRYGQVVATFIRDYLDINGNPRNLADPACGVGSKGLFTPFAADGVTVRADLLWNSQGGSGNQGWFNMGMTKEDSPKVTPDMTVQQTPNGQTLRTARNIFTKVDDKVSLIPLENSELIRRLRYHLPLTGWIPGDGSTDQLARENIDVYYERQIIQFLIDTENNLLAEVFPRVGDDKIGATEFGRKNPYAPDSLSWEVLPDPYSKKPMWICEAGSAFKSEGNFEFLTVPPVVTPITGLKANIVVPTPTDITSPVATVALQHTAGGSWTAGTVGSGPTSANGFDTIQITGLTASQVYNAAQVTYTGSDVTLTSPVSAPFTATAS